MAMVDMKMSKEEAKEQNEPQTADDGPRYPYGLSINLDDDVLGKLGIGDSLKVGDEVTFTAKAMVTSKSGYQTTIGDSESSMGLQITEMEMGGDGGSATTKMLYGKK
jgi:hypothetical protein